MKRATGLLLASFALVVLLAACGGEEETGVLALAFRLDGESPILTAYIGDPTEDPWELPVGPYYIEALDQDDVAISLGAVDIEAGDVVDFPPSFEAAGGVADPERVESLKTVANFLIDFELSEYVFLEAVTAGFTEFPFDPAVEADAADVQELFDIYAEMLAQQDAVEAAFSQIEGRAEVSLGVSYVRSPWAPASGWTEVAKKKLYDWSKGTYSFFYDVLVGDNRKCILAIVDKIPEDKRQEIFSKLSYDKKGDAASFDDWVKKVKEDDWFLIKEGLGISLELGGLAPMAVYESGYEPRKRLAEAGPKAAKYATEKVVEAYRHVPGMKRVFELGDKAKEWAEYAEKLLEKPGVTLEETARGKAQQALEDKIKSNLKEAYPNLSGKAIDAFAQYFAKKAVKAIPRLAGTPTPAAPKTTPAATPAATPKATPAPTPAPTPVPTATPAPEEEWLVPGSGWIEGYVQAIGNEWVAKCFKGDVKEYVYLLRNCLENAMMDGATEEQAKADCPPDVYAPILPDAGWIEGYVEGIANQWLDKEIYGGFDVAAAADDMRQCLTDRFLTLCFSEEGAKAECPAWLFEPVLTPEPTAAATPRPEATATPTPQPTATPAPEGQQVTAVGKFIDNPIEGWADTENTMTLVWDSRGGPIISGEGRHRHERASYNSCGTEWGSFVYHFTGTYDPESGKFYGTVAGEWESLHWREDWQTGCYEFPQSGSYSDSRWEATLEDGVVKSTNFELTVQGQ